MIQISRLAPRKGTSPDRFQVEYSKPGYNAASMRSVVKTRESLRGLLTRTFRIDSAQVEEALARLDREGTARIKRPAQKTFRPPQAA